MKLKVAEVKLPLTTPIHTCSSLWVYICSIGSGEGVRVLEVKGHGFPLLSHTPALTAAGVVTRRHAITRLVFVTDTVANQRENQSETGRGGEWEER